MKIKDSAFVLIDKTNVFYLPLFYLTLLYILLTKSILYIKRNKNIIILSL